MKFFIARLDTDNNYRWVEDRCALSQFALICAIDEESAKKIAAEDFKSQAIG